MALTHDNQRTLYLGTPGTFVGVDHEAFQIRRPDLPLVRAPIRGVDAIACFGAVQVSTEAIARCAETGIDLTWLSRAGRFRAALRGPTSGNVLLRMQQYRAATSTEASVSIASAIVAAKILNSRTLLLDAAKDRSDLASVFRSAGEELSAMAAATKSVRNLDELRGVEGAAAKRYFAQFSAVLSRPGFDFTTRERRPPTDPINALLSFGYALLQSRCVGALERVGLDPQLGYLHAVRPGRPSLALDLIEELRAPVVDRFVLTLINRRQVTERSFEHVPGGSVLLTEDGRRAVLAAWDAHLQGSVPHRVLATPVQRRKLPHVQALLLARHLRGDLAHYLPHRTTGR